MIAFGHSTEASPDTVQKDAPALIATFPDEAAPIDSLQGKIIPQEIVYVHTDNTCYFLGDTLYYKAYVVRSDRGTPSDISHILYAEHGVGVVILKRAHRAKQRAEQTEDEYKIERGFSEPRL